MILQIVCFQLDTPSLQVNLVRPMYLHHQQKYSSSLSLFSWQKLAADVVEVFHVYIQRCSTFPHDFEIGKHNESYPAVTANHILHHNNICLMEIHLRFDSPQR